MKAAVWNHVMRYQELSYLSKDSRPPKFLSLILNSKSAKLNGQLAPYMMIRLQRLQTRATYVFRLYVKVNSFMLLNYHCVKSVQLQSFFWSVFSGIRTEYRDLLRKSSSSVRIKENMDHKKLRIWTLFIQRTCS